MRGLAALAIVGLAACGSTRPIEVPPPFDESGILVTVRPRVYIGWPLGFQTIRGTVENRSHQDVDLRLYLNLEDETGAVVGHVFLYQDGFRRGERCGFEAYTAPGPPQFFVPGLFAKQPHFTKVTPGFAYDEDSLVGNALTIAWLLSHSSS